MILLLILIGVLYAIWGELRDAITIFAVILLLVTAEVVNEFRAKRAIGALERLSEPEARVRRSGKVVTIDTEDVVPGDLLILIPGARVVADAKLVSAVDLSLDESALTGESMPVEKSAGDPIYAGTIVLGGEGEAEATVTGLRTRLGQMSAQLGEVEPPRTPMQQAMAALSGKLVWVAAAFAIIIPIIGILRGGDVRQMILTGLALAFAVIPEEMPIIATMVLSLGSYRLSQQKLIIKRLRAAETLGDATVIMTDKTGTLTEGRLQVASIWPKKKERVVLEAALGTVSPEMPDALEQAVSERATAVCAASPAGEIVRLRHAGEGRRSKATLWREADGTLRLHVTGAPEEVAARCKAVPESVRAQFNKEAAIGRRVVATATRAVAAKDAERPLEELEQDLDFAGIICFADPPRVGVREAIAQLAGAGIRTLMVTGDHPATATAVAREVGIPADRVLTGEQLDGLDDAALGRAVKEVSVFARTSPQHKYRLLTALQKNGDVVAVTGDGVNDALALKAADVGIAMGIRGTDVAKEAAQVVLADDNYATLARGVFEGRHFFDNLSKGVNYYLAVKVALISIFLLPVLAGLPLPFSPIQIILLEMFMDLAASAGFVAEPAESDIERRPPRNATTALVDAQAVRMILFKGALLFLAVMAAYAWATWRGLPTVGIQSCSFAAWMVGHVALAFISRSDRLPIFTYGLFSNHIMNVWAVSAISFVLLAIYLPPLREALRFAEVSPPDLMISAGLALLCVAPAELQKVFQGSTPTTVATAGAG
jgi:Ca2+-transporting ATPase